MTHTAASGLRTQRRRPWLPPDLTHLEDFQAKCPKALEKSVEVRLVEGSRQPGRGGFYPDIDIGERLSAGGPEPPEHSHLELDRLGHLHSNRWPLRQPLGRHRIADHLSNMRQTVLLAARKGSHERVTILTFRSTPPVSGVFELPSQHRVHAGS